MGENNASCPSVNQSRALAWLEANPNVDSYSNFQLIQRYALRTIYESTNGDSWFIKTNWQDSATEECTWQFLTCFGNQVVTINFENDPAREIGNNLDGVFPPEVSIMDWIKRLQMGYNGKLENEAIQDPDGLDWLGDLTQLTFLGIKANGFEATGIPTVLGLLTDLLYLDISKNDFNNEPLDEDLFTNFQEVIFLDIGYNNYAESTIPTTIGGLPNLSKYGF